MSWDIILSLMIIRRLEFRTSMLLRLRSWVKSIIVNPVSFFRCQGFMSRAIRRPTLRCGVELSVTGPRAATRPKKEFRKRKFSGPSRKWTQRSSGRGFFCWWVSRSTASKPAALLVQLHHQCLYNCSSACSLTFFSCIFNCSWWFNETSKYLLPLSLFFLSFSLFLSV